MEVLYPLNVLRNVALLMARTDLVFVIDGDMVISSDLAANLANPTRYSLHVLKFLTMRGSFAILF